MTVVVINPYRFGGGGGGSSSQAVRFQAFTAASAGTSILTLPSSLFDADTSAATTSLTNDIFLAIVETSDADSFSTPAGWAHVTGSPVTNSGIDGTKLHVLWKRAVSDGEVPTFSTGDPGDHWVGRTLVYRYAKVSGNPWNAITSGSGSGSSSFSMTGVTTSVNNCLVLFIASQGEDGALGIFGSWSNSTLTSFGETTEQPTSVGDGGGIVVATGLMATAGATGAATVNCSSASKVAYITIALEPANP